MCSTNNDDELTQWLWSFNLQITILKTIVKLRCVTKYTRKGNADVVWRTLAYCRISLERTYKNLINSLNIVPQLGTSSLAFISDIVFYYLWYSLTWHGSLVIENSTKVVSIRKYFILAWQVCASRINCNQKNRRLSSVSFTIESSNIS